MPVCRATTAQTFILKEAEKRPKGLLQSDKTGVLITCIFSNKGTVFFNDFPDFLLSDLQSSLLAFNVLFKMTNWGLFALWNTKHESGRCYGFALLQQSKSELFFFLALDLQDLLCISLMNVYCSLMFL